MFAQWRLEFIRLDSLLSWQFLCAMSSKLNGNCRNVLEIIAITRMFAMVQFAENRNQRRVRDMNSVILENVQPIQQRQQV